MKALPESDQALVIRTDYSDDAAWNEIREIIKVPVDGFNAYVTYVEDQLVARSSSSAKRQLRGYSRSMSRFGWPMAPSPMHTS